MTRDHSRSADEWTWWALGACMLVVVVLAGVGCATTGAAPEQPAEERALHHITAATVAINAADLDTARHELNRAKPHARSDRLARQVRGLELLIDGAEAIERGDVAGARQHWEAIDDPHLAAEVQRRARAIGIELSSRTTSVSEVTP